MEKTLKKGVEPSKKNKVDSMTADLVEELMNASTSFHKLHLQVEGIGSFAAHKALNELYDALPGLADSIAEGYQGAAEKLLVYNDQGPVILKSVKDAISYLRDITSMVDELQKVMPYSEIVNTLDTVKDAVNSAKYKLIFLK
jgi:DNA-binding ferritin-like protein